MENEKDNSAMRPDDPEFLLSQYLDGQLEPDAMEQLEERLGRDISLRKQMQRYAKLDEMLADLREPVELDEVDFDSQRMEIMAVLERKALLRPKKRFHTLRWTLAGAGALAAAALIAVGSWAIFRTSAVVTPSGPEIVRVQVAPPEAPAGQVTVSLVAPEQDPIEDDQVAVECERMPDKDLAKWRQREAQDAPPSAVIMTGASPQASEPPPNTTADLLLD